ncbi:MAG: FadR family transcriptional regulator [Desulfobacterales bacterium]|nr:MAG: FadR family transcriptional regulator [Desulfobacterales bacterium]
MENISRPKLSDLVSETLVAFILESGLQPGDKLPTESVLTKKLGIGRTSVREGIRQLEAIGLLSSRQGYGVILNKVTLDMLFPLDRKIQLADFLTLNKKEILDLMSLRLVIELDACRLAAANIGPDGLQVLQELLQAMEKSIADPKSFIVPDMEFHKQIAMASGNIVYPRIFDIISEMFRKQQAIVASLPGAKDRASRYHKEIYLALERGDADQAVAVMKNHLENTTAAIAENL